METVLRFLGLSSAPKEAGEEGEVARPKPQNLNDHYSLKRHLDEVATEIVVSVGYEEDFFWSNVKIALGLASCACALVAQFYPAKFPHNAPLLLACVALYVLFNAALQGLAIWKEKNTFLFTKPQKGSFLQTGIAVSSVLPRYSDMYTLRIESVDPKSIAAKDPVEMTKSITKWYTSEGILAEDIFLEDVQRLLQSYQEGTRKTK